MSELLDLISNTRDKWNIARGFTEGNSIAKALRAVIRKCEFCAVADGCFDCTVYNHLGMPCYRHPEYRNPFNRNNVNKEYLLACIEWALSVLDEMEAIAQQDRLSPNGRSISDDDLCSSCALLEYYPGDTSFCELDFPGQFDEDGYCQACKERVRCETGENVYQDQFEQAVEYGDWIYDERRAQGEDR